MDFEAFLRSVDAAVAQLPQRIAIVDGPDQKGQTVTRGFYLMPTLEFSADTLSDYPYDGLRRRFVELAAKHQATLHILQDGGFRFEKRE